MTFIDLCRTCGPITMETCLVGITDGRCARCGKRGASPDLARFRVELPPERQAFIAVLRARKLDFQKQNLRRFADRHPESMAVIGLALLSLSVPPPSPKRHSPS